MADPAYILKKFTQNIENNIVTLADGRYLLSWVELTYPDNLTTNYTLSAAIYTADGILDGSVFTVATSQDHSSKGGTELRRPSVVALADGGFAVAWGQVSNSEQVDWVTTSTNVIKMRVYGEDGKPVSTVQTISDIQDGYVARSAHLTAFGKGFFAAWEETGDDPNNAFSFGIRARAFDKKGDPLLDDVLDDPTWINGTRVSHQTSPTNATLTDGSVVVTFADRGDVHAIVFGKDGDIEVPEFTAHKITAGIQNSATVAALTDGRFVISALSPTESGGKGAFIQIFGLDRSGAGTKVTFDGDPILLTELSGKYDLVAAPNLVGTAGGGFFVAWIEYAKTDVQDEYVRSLHGQFFKADGSRDGDELLIGSAKFIGGLILLSDAYSNVMLAESQLGTILLSWVAQPTGGDAYRENYVLKAPAIPGPGNDIIEGTPGKDTLRGLAGNDKIRGYGDDDLLDGGPGADQMWGGKGNDTYVVDNAADKVIELPDEGTDTVRSSISYTLTNHVENLVLMGAKALDGTGNSLANTLTGNAAANVLDGRKGADRLVGGKGDDTYIVDNAKDAVVEKANEGTDLVKASVSHTLSGNVENLTLTGTSKINGTGNSLANVLTGNGADNVLDGKAGADKMSGGKGNDTYIVDNAKDTVVEKAKEGTDLVKASVSHTLSGNVENLALTGKEAINGTGNGLDNMITGNSGKNTLKGGAGNDTLHGGGGADDLYGGAGKDIFVFNSVKDSAVAAKGQDTIFDFNGEGGDRIDLSGIDARVSTTQDDAFTFIGTKAFSKKAGELRYEKKPSDTYVYGDTNGDGKADFAIHLDDPMSLANGYFLL